MRVPVVRARPAPSTVGRTRPPRAGFAGNTPGAPGVLARDLVEIVDLTDDPAPLDSSGWWVVAGTFEGRLTGYRFATVTRGPADDLPEPGRWRPVAAGAWRSSLDAAGYRAGVAAIAEHIAAGDVYQVNLCRVLTAPDPGGDPVALAARLATGNPAPLAGWLDLGDDWIVSASPELFLRRDGGDVVSAPVKGTARPGQPFADKDFPENVMITDLVRNDLGRVAVPGTVRVTGLLEREEHPGLAHLVSTVGARLRPGVGWRELLAATLPPGSVSGAPKIRALQVIRELEPIERGIYCGCFGWVDADRGTARLAVGIRTFARTDGLLRFGTGAGITWGSDPQAEWQETQLKAARLVALASD